MSFRFPLLALLAFSSAAVTAQQAPPPVEVLSPHWIALRFDPQFPHGRHTQNPLPGNALTLPLPESQMIRNQAGQNSDNEANNAVYAVPVPDVAADAGVDRAIFLGDLKASYRQLPVLDRTPSNPVACPPEACGPLKLTASQQSSIKRFGTSIDNIENPAEFFVSFYATKEDSITLYDATGPNHFGPTLLLHTRGTLPTGFKSSEQSGLPLPKLTPLFNQFLRDTSIVLAADGNYYMTGTTGGPEMMIVTSDLSVWKSPDLAHWSPVRDLPRQSTVVWNLDRDGPRWMQPLTMRDGEPFRPLWAPEIHFINNTFWIPFSVPRHGITLLKSTSGKAEGPYEVALHPDEPLSTGIDASLFQDDDGTVYSLYGGGWIAKMKPDMSGLAESYRHITSSSGREVGFEGVYLFKDHGLYQLCVADFVLGEYNTYIATAKSLNGPWSERYLAVPHAGHANFFRDKQGRMWSTFFGNDRHSPYSAEPGIVPLMQDSKGRWRPDPAYIAPQKEVRPVVQVSGAIGPSDGTPQNVGIMPAKKKL